MATSLVFLFLLFCLDIGSFAFSTSDPIMTSIKYRGQDLPIWESKGRYLVAPVPHMEPNLTRVQDRDIVGTHGDNVHLEFCVSFMQDDIKRLSLNAIREATGRCVQIDEISVAPIMVRFNLTNKSFHVQKIWNIMANDSSVQLKLGCPSKIYCNVIKAVVVPENIIFSFKISGNEIKKQVGEKKNDSKKSVKETSCDISRIQYMLNKLERHVNKLDRQFNRLDNIINHTVLIEAKLQGASSSNRRGRLLVRKQDHPWGTACDDYFDLNQNGAKVACRQIYGLENKGKWYRAPGGSGISHYDNAQCKGHELNLILCPHRWFPSNQLACGHGEDIGVDCN